MSPVCVHFKTSKRWSSSSLTFSYTQKWKTLPDIYNTDFLCSGQSKMFFKKMPHKMWTHSQRIISTTRGQESEDRTSVWASVSSMRNLFASLDQFGQTNFNHSHSNEPIRKYTVWPLNPKYLRLLRSSPVQKMCTTTRATAAATPQLQRGALHTSTGPVWGAVVSDPVCSRCRQQSPVGPLRTHSSENKANQYKNYNQIHILCQPFVFARHSCGAPGPLRASFTVILKCNNSNFVAYALEDIHEQRLGKLLLYFGS